MAAFNGTEDGDSISSSGMPRGATLFSSTYGGNDTVSIFRPSHDLHLGDGNDTLSGSVSGFAHVEMGNDRLNVFSWEEDHAHHGGDGDDAFSPLLAAPGRNALTQAAMTWPRLISTAVTALTWSVMARSGQPALR